MESILFQQVLHSDRETVLPVGPTMRLMHPGLNGNSSSTRNAKRRLDGVEMPEPLSLDQVNVAALKPISLSFPDDTRLDTASPSGENSSKSSV